MTDRIIGFAHRGAPLTPLEQNTLPAFQRALDLGAVGLETDIGLTADGVPVLRHTGLSLGRGLQVQRTYRQQLPEYIPSLADLYERCGTHFELSLDMAEPRAVDAVISVAQQYDALDRLWLTYWRLPTLERWRQRWPEVHLIYPTIPLMPGRSNRSIERLAALRVDALNLYYRFCAPGVIEHAHTHHLLIFAWGIKKVPDLERIVKRGVDGVFCDDVEAMVRLSSPPY